MTDTSKTTQKPLRVPISIAGDGQSYSCLLFVGSRRAPAYATLDTGSSTLAIAPSVYNPAVDGNAKPTDLAQYVSYDDNSGWFGPVVKTSITLGNSNITLNSAPIAVTDIETKGNFTGSVDGIIGLAYYALNDAYKFPSPTYPWPFPSAAYRNALQKFHHYIKSEKIPTTYIDPYFNELEQHGLTMNKFAFYTLRSYVHRASNNRTAIDHDPLNSGIFVLGGGEQETDLFTGSFSHVKVYHDVYYNTNLVSTQVEGCAESPAKPLQPEFQAGTYTNSIIDSGTNILSLAYDVFQSVIANLESLNPTFGSLIRLDASTNDGVPMEHVHLSKWPDIHFFLTGADGKPVRLTCTPSTYWQTNYPTPGYATFQIEQETTASQASQSLLGLPLFNNYYAVFDRSGGKGKGVIGFAAIVRPQLSA
jgi:hypothetical protein